MSTWTPSCWRLKPQKQAIAYPDNADLDGVLQQVAALPPLVTSWEVENLKGSLADAAVGKQFLLHAGDCAEDFSDCQADVIVRQLKILLQMSLILFHGCRKRVIKVGRIAGQYAKPRSLATETRDGVTLPAYRGANINRPGFTEEDRNPDPDLLLKGHQYAATTLNFVRALAAGGFADLHHPEYWSLNFFEHSRQTREYLNTTEMLRDAIGFMESLTGRTMQELTRVDFYTSHEALHLPYEQATTREVPWKAGWYNLSTHFPWIGDRTRLPGGAHVEYCRGIANPIGLKIGPSIVAEELVELIHILNPDNIAGRLTLIHRFGANEIKSHLPRIIKTVQNTGKTVVWCCDPMHGNTRLSQSGMKTRRFDDLMTELDQAFAIHEEMGSILGGVHLELTGEEVTECLGGAQELTEADLARAYKTHVDPRLNYQQALEVALLISRDMSRAAGADQSSRSGQTASARGSVVSTEADDDSSTSAPLSDSLAHRPKSGQGNNQGRANARAALVRSGGPHELAHGAQTSTTCNTESDRMRVNRGTGEAALPEAEPDTSDGVRNDSPCLCDESHTVIDLEKTLRLAMMVTPDASGPTSDQASQAVSTIRAILKKQPVPVQVSSQTVFLRSRDDIEPCRKVFSAYFGDRMPATNYIVQPPCGGQALAIEVWALGGEDTNVEFPQPNLARVSYDGLQWTHVSGVSPSASSLDAYGQSRDVFDGLASRLESCGATFNDVVRTWLYQGGITETEEGKERYQELNRARTDFFAAEEEASRMQVRRNGALYYPASTGIGMAGRGLAVSCLALQTERDDVQLQPLENPRQTSSFDYAARFSPKSPKFARAMAMIIGDYVTTWISGTASIVDSESVHLGDIEKQTEQTIGNIEALISSDNFQRHGVPNVDVRLTDLAKVRVYIKHREDYDKCRAICERHFGGTPVIYAVADVCRSNLLVEIEGVAFSQRQ